MEGALASEGGKTEKAQPVGLLRSLSTPAHSRKFTVLWNNPVNKPYFPSVEPALDLEL